MRAAPSALPHVRHALPGRVRLHLGQWAAGAEHQIERRLLALDGVTAVLANPPTGNVLIHFDPTVTDLAALVAAAAPFSGRPPHLPREEAAPTADARPPTLLLDAGTLPAAGDAAGPPRRRARIAVRGIDRDPAVARQVVEQLERLPGVRATASPLTGRVVVDFPAQQLGRRALLAAVAAVELPGPDEETPSHPLDPAPLVQGVARTAGAGLGLAFAAAQRAPGGPAAFLGAPAAAAAAALLGLVQAFPATRNGLRLVLGRNVADLVTGGAGILALTLAGNPLGLALAGAEALRLVTEVTARRAAWRRYEARLAEVAPAQPGAVIRLDAGDRAPLAATVVDGVGTALGRGGLPVPAVPGAVLSAGARVQGGPLTVTLLGTPAFTPTARPVPLPPTLVERYARASAPLSLAAAVAVGVLTRAPAGALAGLALVNPRAALIGTEAAATGAAARVVRAGVTVAGSRPERAVRLPDVLLIDGPRVLTDGLEVAGVVPLGADVDATDALSLAAAVAAASGAPWGGVFRANAAIDVGDGHFDGVTASAGYDGSRFTLGPLVAAPPAPTRPPDPGVLRFALAREHGALLALFTLRPKLAPGVAALARACRQHGVLPLLLAGDRLPVAQAVADRAGVAVLAAAPLAAAVRERQAAGALVAVLSDSADAAEAFAAADLAIGLTSGRSNRFAARADLLAPDLAAVAAIITAGARARSASRDAVAASALANVAGAAWGVRATPGFANASLAVYAAALAALVDGWARLRGGQRPPSTLTRLVDPRPERWGRRRPEDVLRALTTTADGLTSAEAAARRRAVAAPPPAHPLRTAVAGQLRSPITAILAGGGALSLALGAPLDAALIGATVAVGVAVGVWQERRAGQAVAVLTRLGAATARVLRDGVVVTLPAAAIVPGDVLVLAPGDRVAADARVLTARTLEVDEAALTGESLPVPKASTGLTAAGRVVLEGSDITVGTGRAVVVAIGGGTRLGATVAALAGEDTAASPLGQRLGRLLRQVLPLAGGGGLAVVGAGLLRGQPLLPQLALGASLAIAAVPEGLPLLTGVGQAAVASRLAGRRALVRRLGAVEALGRVDVACTDKTGTLTEGRPALTLVATLETEVALPASPPRSLPDALQTVVRAAGLASPHPASAGAAAHPTDRAVIAGAEQAGLGEVLRRPRAAEAPFDPTRAYHASVTDDRLYVKGAVEVLLPRCRHERRNGADGRLDDAGRARWRERAEHLAARGLRVLMVATGPAESPVDDPQGLTALGFVGISDPLRAGVADAVRRCREAGVRVVMVTGDHPVTAAAIARAAGILDGAAAAPGQGASPGGDPVLSGPALADLDDGALERRLEGVTVIARVTPLDKLRIVESLQRRGHTVAMTGDGVNDAPALRLADVGVAMGRGGTEVARQAADVVLADDDFATLVEALVEGRSFWRNLRRALGLLLGGNLGELGLVVGASVVGLAAPLVTRQILAVNLITDALPALAVAVQPPADRNLQLLAREGAQSLDRPLREDVLRRGLLAGGPALLAYVLALPGGLPAARAVALGSIVATQLAQTLEAGRAEGGLSRPVLGAVAASGGLLGAALVVPPLRAVLAIGALTPQGWLLIGGATTTTLVLGRVLAGRGGTGGLPALPAPPQRPMLPAAEGDRAGQ